jgi:hypothetical protein
VEEVWQGNVHGVEPFIGQHVPVVSVEFAGRQAGQPASRHSAHDAGVGYRDYFDQIGQFDERGQVGGFRDPAKTDDADSLELCHCDILPNSRK